MADYDDIFYYIEFLKKEYNFHVCINDFVGGKIEEAFSKNQNMLSYITHTHPYCMKIKQKNILWERCIENKQEIIKKCIEKRNSFYHVCYGGVKEYVNPIFQEDVLIGAITIGAFSKKKQSKEKIITLIKKYNIDDKQFYDFFMKTKIENIYDQKSMDHISGIVCKRIEDVWRDKKTEMVGSKAPFDMDLYYISNIIEYIKQNYDKDITLETLADFCHISKSKISHIFKQYTNKNIKAYINTIRVEESKKMLSHTKKPIYIISKEVGFKEPNYFTNCFSQLCNMTPTEYRASKKKISK